MEPNSVRHQIESTFPLEKQLEKLYQVQVTLIQTNLPSERVSRRFGIRRWQIFKALLKGHF